MFPYYYRSKQNFSMTALYFQTLHNQTQSKLTIMPLARAKTIIKAMYKAKLFAPKTIFKDPKLVIFVAGPVIIKAEAEPILIPDAIHCCKRGIVPPPQAYRGTPIVAAIKSPKPLLFTKRFAKASAGTYLWKSAERSMPMRK